MITAPFSGTFCASVNCASRAGRHVDDRISAFPTPHRSIWVIADITIGPRQITAVSSPTEADRHNGKAETLNRIIFLSSLSCGFSLMPVSRGTDP
jgi:hypothetical protein